MLGAITLHTNNELVGGSCRQGVCTMIEVLESVLFRPRRKQDAVGFRNELWISGLPGLTED